ncbi:MAG: hypothetical protein LBM93_06270 [Oscillospiraceae bacterium]|nr:hypothetical protein [Oscillospiraceae bacterium]
MAYIFSIFTAYLCSYVIKWDICLTIEDIFGHIAGRIIVEIACFGFCVFQGLYILWFVAKYVKGKNSLSMSEFLKVAGVDLDRI